MDIMEKNQIIKAVIAGIAIITASVLIVINLGGSDDVSSRELRSIIESRSDEELITMRQNLAAQIAEANRTRSGEKSSILLGYERMLSDYDDILRRRDIDPDQLPTPSLAEVPVRDGEGP